LLAE
jgi:hypothetical protein